MIANIRPWSAHPTLPTSSRRRALFQIGSEMIGLALEVIGLIVFVAVLGGLSALLAVVWG